MQLRPYQEESIEQLRQGFKAGHKRQVLCASTGAGKSVIMKAMIKSVIQKGSRALFICERRVLVEQFSKHLDEIGIDHGVLMAGTWRFKPDLPIQVASAQTLERMESWPNFDVVFIDELHVALRKSVIALIEDRPELRIIGATATPFNPMIGKHFTAITSVITMKELVDQGNLVPFRVFVAHEVDTKGIKIVAGEYQKDELETRALKIVGDVVADYIRLSNEVFGGYRKTICFSAGVAHGTELVTKFNENGIAAIQISYKDSDEYKAEVLAEFRKPDSSIKMLISTAILERGFDQTDVEHIILARPIRKSFSSHVQMCGRGARPHEGKSYCVIQDNAGNWLRFADKWDDLFHNGVKVLSCDQDVKAPKELTEVEKEAAKCPKCSALWGKLTDTCPHCGFVRVKKSVAQAVAGEMTELYGQKPDKYSSEYKEKWYHGMLSLLNAHGKNESRAYHLYKEKFGINPPWKKAYGVVTPEVIGYLKMANIAFAKGRRK